MSDPDSLPPEPQAPVEVANDELDRYTLRGRRQIRLLLQQLIDARPPVTVYPDPQHSFVSRILALVEDDDALLLDSSQDADMNRRVLQSNALRCVTELGKIRIQFKLDGVDAEESDGHTLFNAWVPPEILRFQRREFFRLETPLQNRPQCRLNLRDAAGRPDTLQAPVIDIGAGGLAVAIADGEASFSVGERLHGCSLELSGAPPLALNLEVRDIGSQRFPSGIVRQRIGFRFHNLSADTVTRLERYVLKAQRERAVR